MKNKIERINPFREIYKSCNSGDPLYKYKNMYEFPKYIDIELTNNCNYRCLMCPVGIGTMKRKRGFMTQETFIRIIDEIKNYKTPLRFIRWGEPTLHKNYIDFIEIAKNNGIMCHINTNGSMISDENMDRLISIGLDSIKFSFQGIDDEGYKEMRNTNKFDDLIKTISILYNKRGNENYPYIHISTTTTYETEKEINIFKERVGNIADLVTVGRTILHHISTEGSRMTEEEERRLKVLKTKESLVRERKSCCPEVFDKLSINWDGLVTACCSDYDNKMIIGDLHENSLEEIWRSDKMNQYRKILSERRYNDIELCSNCYDCMNTQTK